MKHTIKRQLLSLLLAVSLAFSAFPAAVLAQGETGAENPVQGKLAPINQEYLDYLDNGGSGSAPSTLDLAYLTTSYRRQTMRRNALLPASFDLRDYGRSPRVPDQGSYGTCWAFAAIGSAESGLIEQFPGVSLSQWHLAWFTYTGAEEEEFGELGYNANKDPFNNGGNDPLAVGTMAAWKGPVDSQTLPYETEEIDQGLRTAADFHLQDAFYLTNGSYGFNDPALTALDTQTVKQILMEDGAVSILYASAGVESYYNEETYAFYRDEPAGTDHVVLIVGWDDQFSRDNFNQDCRPEQDGAWLIRNSWGTSWGDDGYFWLSYEDKSISYGCNYQLEPADNYARNYQYDTIGWGISASADDFTVIDKAAKSAYLSNIFTAEDTEQLEAVSFYTTDASTQYEISVYTGVQEGEPASGNLAYSGQTGVEEYAGYHTIELDRAVALRKGENFSVVIKLTNPSYPYPIPLEICFLPYSQSEPLYMGNGGESYYSLDGQSWQDVTSLGENLVGYHFSATNICLKAFTNPLPDEGQAVSNVRFSLAQGPVALGTELELSGADEIYYQITPAGGAAQEAVRYTGPIELQEACSVTAWSQSNGKEGNRVTRSYSQAASELTELAVEQEGTNVDCDVQSGETEYFLTLNNLTDHVKIRPRGCDSITVNGVLVDSDSWSESLPIAAGEITPIEVTSSAQGKTTTTYTVNVYRSALTYDYRNETVSYDTDQYALFDKENQPIASGASITPYLVNEGEEDVELALMPKDSIEAEQMIARREVVPKRRLAVSSPIDYENECTQMTYGNWNEVADNPEMENATVWDGTNIPVTPGQQIYIRKYATDTAFASAVIQLSIPSSRPPAPDAVVASVSADSITMQPVEGAQYRIAPDGGWQDENTLTLLEMDTDYTVEMRLEATGENFASETASVNVKTGRGLLLPVSYQYNGLEIGADTYTAASGENLVTADAEFLAENGFLLKDPAADRVLVQVTEQEGSLIADVEQVVFDVVPTRDPAEFSFQVSYWDKDGNQLEGGGTLPFYTVGPLSRDSIPLPYGYQEIAPEDPDESWEYPTGLYYSDGWYVYPQKVAIQVEKMACVNVVFQTEDGSVLEERELCYSEGAGLERVIPPEGYEILGEDTFALDVTRDEEGNLVADPGQVCFTVQPAIDPASYSFTVRYEDALGNPVPGGGELHFDAVGPYSRENIPLPYGYQQLIPAHPDESWLYPTALECIDGVWQPTVTEVVLQVEKMACVNVVFETPDGFAPPEGYEVYFGEEGEQRIDVAAPEGYELTGESSFTVLIRRDEDNALLSEPDTVTVTIQKIVIPDPEPSPDPEPDPETPAQNDRSNTKPPQTGEDGQLILLVSLTLFGAGASLFVLSDRRKKKK